MSYNVSAYTGYVNPAASRCLYLQYFSSFYLMSSFFAVILLVGRFIDVQNIRKVAVPQHRALVALKESVRAALRIRESYVREYIN